MRRVVLWVLVAVALVAVGLGAAATCRPTSDKREGRVGGDGAAFVTSPTPGFAVIPEERVIPTPTPEPAPEPEPEPAPEPPVAVPVRLRIPRIRVDARIVPVGVDYTGAMASPKDAWSVAWYEPGYKPWEQGNAVLAGHVDYINVGPAVFWNVRNLTAGDHIFITAADGQEYEFEVKEVLTYKAADAPLDRIFGPNPNRGVNLITCTGNFNARTLEYDQRIVVYTEAVNAPPPRPSRTQAIP